ncbi:hypothetical protein EIP91_002923 [Steccherinum ochraceum]|uniref:Uncharacterized protein n=1 Tax=Steccherinum ochraceum TaxID=92696 RepID=A0A4R0RJS6_9APHY|nr:hypothetical protein EIP91_002923 [Steccherinum ochraceum]
MVSSRVTLFILVLLAPCAVSGLPLSTVPEASPPPTFALWLCIPFVLLAVFKVTYMKFRRAQSIHDCEATPVEGTTTQLGSFSSFRGLGLKFPSVPKRPVLWKKDITGYLVGCLGSPEWETRIKRRVDRAVRKSKEITSAVTSPRISITDHTYSTADNTRTSKGTIGVSRANTTTSSRHPSRRSSQRSGSRRSQSVSVSFLEMQTPHVHVPDITNCGVIHPSSPPCPDASFPLHTNSLLKTGDDRKWRRRKLSISHFSPILMQVDPPPEPVSDAPKRSLDRSIKSGSDESRTRSYSKTPSFQEPSTSSNVSSDSIASIPSGEITVNLSVSQAPTSPNPEASVLSYPHSVSESLDEFSYIVGPDGSRVGDWTVDEVMRVPKQNRTPSRSVAPTHVPTTPVLPLSPSLKSNSATSPDSSAIQRSGGSSRSKASSMHAEVHSNTSPVLDYQEPSAPSGSNPRFSGDSAAKDWILEDLLRDGRLDVDAVSGVLGLDLGFLDDPTPNNDSIFGNTSHLSDTPASPAKEGMGWGRAAVSGSTSFDIQIRKPGGPLCVIPEETEDDASSKRASGSHRWSNRSEGSSVRPSKESGDYEEAYNHWISGPC